MRQHYVSFCVEESSSPSNKFRQGPRQPHRNWWSHEILARAPKILGAGKKLLLLAIFASRATVNSKSTSLGRASVMPTRNVNLTDELDRFVAKKVKTGRYENASEVVRAGLRTLEREEQQYEAKIAALKAAIDAGDASGIAEGNVFGRVRKALKLPVSSR